MDPHRIQCTNATRKNVLKMKTWYRKIRKEKFSYTSPKQNGLKQEYTASRFLFSVPPQYAIRWEENKKISELNVTRQLLGYTAVSLSKNKNTVEENTEFVSDASTEVCSSSRRREN